MTRTIRLIAAGMLAAFVLTPPPAVAEVHGRYVRIEAPASSRMGLYEVEVFAKETNIASQTNASAVSGLGYQGRDIDLGNDAEALSDGVIDRENRAIESGTGKPTGVLNPWVELDFGSDRPLDRLAIHSTLKPSYDDRGIRLVSVLDAERRVVWCAVYDIGSQPFNTGLATFGLTPDKGPLIGRTVPAGVRQWAPLGDLLEVAPAADPADASARLTLFQDRNSPAAIERLARDFFARIDLEKPELAGVKHTFQRQEYSAALDAYRDHFLTKLGRCDFPHEHPAEAYGVVTSPGLAEDLTRNVAIGFSRFDVEGSRFTPGAINWTDVRDGTPEQVGLARSRVRAGMLSWPLLQTYRETGRPELLGQWVAITDDWGMNIRDDLDRAAAGGLNLRDYFVKTESQYFNHLVDLLGKTAQERPEFTRLLPGATLARLLIPVVEEYPPAYWWVCRRASFNHTYNALNAATTMSRVLDDFHAGQRLDRENRQHWERIWSQTITRDGSMNEVSDEGHWLMHWRINPTLHQMKKVPPPWYTPEFAAEVETGWNTIATYAVRWLAPGGRGHVSSTVPLVTKFWDIGERRLTYGGMIPREMTDSSALLRSPEVAAIVYASFVAGQDRATLSAEDQESYDKVAAYYGSGPRSPRTASDWMPYAGLYYLRENWQPDALFCHMRSQPTGHPSTGDERFGTWFDLRQGTEPLVRVRGVSIDGLTQFPAAGARTYQPGSKTDQLATASEDPIPARWHTSARFDYAEAFYDGTYRNCTLKTRNNLALNDATLECSPAIEHVRTQRRLLFVRPARLVIAVDAVHVPGPVQPRRYELSYAFAPTAIPPARAKEPKLPPPADTLEGDARCTSLRHERGSGLTLRRFSSDSMNWTPAKASGLGAPGSLRVETAGDLLMSSLYEPHRQAGDLRVMDAIDLSDADHTGFRAALADGATLIWLATPGEPRVLKAGGLELKGEGLLLYHKGAEHYGLILGGQTLVVSGQPTPLPAADCEFTLEGSELTRVIPIMRPIAPVRFSPNEQVFTDTQTVALTSNTPGVEIRYTLDGTEPDLDSTLYASPITITSDAFIRARAFRPGIKEVPFTADGTVATVTSNARYVARDLQPAVAVSAEAAAGVRWELVGGNWFSLFSHLNLPDVLPAGKSGHTKKLLDVSMREGDGSFGVRYSGFIEIPADGVWTFHAPAEYVGANCEPGYDLRVWVDGKEWDLGQQFHGRGLWSVPLARGPHRLLVTFADARNRARAVPESQLWRGYPRPWVIWQGEAPTLEISGPQLEKQAIPAAWLRH